MIIMKIEKQLPFLFFFYISVFHNYLQKIIPVFQYFDEALALIAVPIFLLETRKRHGKLRICKFQTGYGRHIIFLVMIGLAGSLLFHYQSVIAVLSDLLLAIKFWLALYVGKHLLKNFLCKKNAGSIFFHIKLVTRLYIILIVADHLLGGIFPADIRYGLRSTQLFYSHPTYFAGACIYLIAVLLSIRDWVIGFERYFILLLFLLCSTLRSKAIGVALAVAIIYYFVYIGKRKFSLKTVLIFVPLVIALGWNQIEFYFFNINRDQFARYQLLIKSILIASDHFPLGAGFATFGSYFSAVYYSPLYKMYRISYVHGLSAQDSSSISDSFWPMVLGQFGWLGLVAYGLALLALYLCLQKMRKTSRAFYISGLSILTYLLISSVAESAFVSPSAVPLAVWMGVLLQTTYSKEQDEVPCS